MRWPAVLAALAGAALFASLGVWQLQRLSWKHDLIARVEARVDARPVSAPGPAAWSGITQETAEYLRVRVSGRFLPGKETFVRAVTERGGGYWVLAPLATDEGFVVLVNRGFVPPERRDAAAGPSTATVTGLLRLTEPDGGFLRSNDPARDRWYSRDVAAIAAARGLGRVAPYFIDADAAPNPGGWPVGGLTRVRFSDNHLVYALTWFCLAFLALVAVWRLLHERRPRRGLPSDAAEEDTASSGHR